MVVKLSSKPASDETSAVADKLIDFRAVNSLLGLRCRTSHTARAMAHRGQIRAVSLNGRVMRYSLASVMELVLAGSGEPRRNRAGAKTEEGRQ